MNNSIEFLQMEFNNRASHVFFSLYQSFRNSVASIDRQRDENVFQQQLGKYATMLQQQLEAIAGELMSKVNGTPVFGQLKESLQVLKNRYTMEFAQKIKGL